MRLDKSSNVRKRVMKELYEGRELATQLGVVLQGATPHNSAARDLIKEVTGTIDRALVALESGVEPAGDDDWGKKRKIQFGQKGGYRMRSHPYSFTMTKAKTLVDGHSWRKYGQKAIHTAQFPRSYFRCTYKHDQGCKATRQVQRSEEDPSSFAITYFGKHTCRDPLQASSFSTQEEEDSCILDFASNTRVYNGREQPKLSILKQEFDQDVVSNNNTMIPESSTSCDFDFAELETVEEFVGGEPKLNDVPSGGVQSWDFLDDLFSFEQDDVFRDL